MRRHDGIGRVAGRRLRTPMADGGAHSRPHAGTVPSRRSRLARPHDETRRDPRPHLSLLHARHPTRCGGEDRWVPARRSGRGGLPSRCTHRHVLSRLFQFLPAGDRRDSARPGSVSARAVMVCGTSSGAGKSLLATALARWYARQGLKVAPFKAQNMSNNARVADGGEMGSAQNFQALASRRTPEVRMNPILLKPEGDTLSQVILLGQRRDELSRMEWRERAGRLWPTVRGCLEDLAAEHEVLVIEGAGSPAEINLQSGDLVNMRVAEAAGASTLI